MPNLLLRLELDKQYLDQKDRIEQTTPVGDPLVPPPVADPRKELAQLMTEFADILIAKKNGAKANGVKTNGSNGKAKKP